MYSIRYGQVRVFFGEGAVKEMPRFLGGYKKALVVTGRKSARVSGALDDVLGALREAEVDYELYDGVVPNPTDEVVDEIAGKASSLGADVIIAIGGGSVIDSAKFAAAILCSGGRARDYLLGGKQASCARPVLAVNLTHGTGSEIDRYSVANIEDEKLKLGIDSTYPLASFDDPRYAATLPENQTRYTSIDAFYHALESSTSMLSSPFTRMLAAESVKLIAGWLPRAIENPDNLEARENLLYSAAIAGIAIDNSLTHIVHSLEHTLSGENQELPHGAGLAILGPRSVYYMYKARPSVLAEVLRPVDETLRPVPDDAAKAEAAVRRFQESVGLTEKLSDYGFSESESRRIASRTIEVFGRLIGVAPMQVTEELLADVYLSGF